MTPLAIVGPSHENSAGVFVPITSQEHLRWWLNNVPIAEAHHDKALVMMSMRCIQGDAECTKVPEDIRGHFLVRVCEKRMASMGIILSPWAVVLLAAACSNPAEIVILCFILKLYSVTHHQNRLDCNSVLVTFHNGFPSEAGFKWLWDLQKLKVQQGQIMDNLLDCVTMRPAVNNAT